MGERQLSQLLGNHTATQATKFLFIREYFQRDPLQAKDRSQYTSDLTAFGGTNFDTLYGNPGTMLAGNQLWAIPKGQTGKSLTAADLTPGSRNLYNQYQGTDVTPGEKRWSVFAKENQRLTDLIRQIAFRGLVYPAAMSADIPTSLHFHSYLSVPRIKSVLRQYLDRGCPERSPYWKAVRPFSVHP